MFRTWAVILLLLMGLVWSMGEKPTPKKIPINGAVEQAEFEATPESQFSRGFRRFLDAKQAGYQRYGEMAAKDFENYLKVYPQGSQKLEVYFWLSRVYQFMNNYALQEDYLNKYFTEATTANSVYHYAELDQATILQRNNQTEQALTQYDRLLSENITEEGFKREIYNLTLPIYEAQGNADKLIGIYTYLIDNREYLENKNLYTVYCYKLGVIYFNKGDKQLARKYLKLVVEDKTAQAQVLAGSAKDYLKKL